MTRRLGLPVGARGIFLSNPLNKCLEASFQAIGYRQIADSLAGKWSLDEAVRDTIAATRRFAKRQLTWFRKQSGVRWFSAEDLEHCLAEIETSLR